MLFLTQLPNKMEQLGIIIELEQGVAIKFTKLDQVTFWPFLLQWLAPFLL